jgi:hypothetical protein
MRFEMKMFTVLLLAFALVLPAYSQDTTKTSHEDEAQTLIGSGHITNGGYGAPELKFTQIQGNWGLMMGGRGGWIINHTFSIGGGGYGLLTSHKIENYQPPFDTTVYLRTGWGGLFLEYINCSNSLVHFTINALIGGGGAVYTRAMKDVMYYDYNGRAYETSAFFVLEPGATVDLNVTKFMRISLGAGYRIISGLNLSRTTNKDLGGASINLAFKFGKF